MYVCMYICRQLNVKATMFSLGVYDCCVLGMQSLYRYLLAKFDCVAKPLTAIRKYGALHLDSDDALRSIGNIQVTIWQPLHFTMIRIQSCKQKTVQNNILTISNFSVLNIFSISKWNNRINESNYISRCGATNVYL